MNGELFGFFFDFAAQHRVVGELYEFFAGHFGGNRENGGGFAGTGNGIHNGIMPGFCIIKDDELLVTKSVHKDIINKYNIFVLFSGNKVGIRLNGA